MKRLCVILSFIILLGCKHNPQNYLEYINGYWEIEKVIFENGDEKIYTYNETIDYININDSLKGFRKKLKPTFNNTYISTEDVEGITAKLENDSLNLYYKTPYNSWKETVMLANEHQLKVINTNKVIYLYKRFKGLELDIK